LTAASSEKTAEHRRLAEDARREKNWKRWGPYLSDRQWGTVREDYSADGDCWNYFPHDHARSRAYRWGEDGLLGICDRKCRLCFALALWNGRDPILKERLFGLTNSQGNHGEDVKECYYYLDSSPTHSYMKALYKYPQVEFPYGWLEKRNARRGRDVPEFELTDTGVFDESRYFDVFVEYAKAQEEDILIRITVANRGPASAVLALLPTLWFRNTWSWGCKHEGCTLRQCITRCSPTGVRAEHESLGPYRFEVEPIAGDEPPELLFTDNDTNLERLYGAPNFSPYVRDAFHNYVIHGRKEAVNPKGVGTKVAAWYRLSIPAGEAVTVRLRLAAERQMPELPFNTEFDNLFEQRRQETGEFYDTILSPQIPDAERAVARQAYAGLLWSKQFYHYIVEDWLEGDPNQPPPPASRRQGRNHDWIHIYNRDLVSVPDKWEYPWYAAWDLAFHMLPFAEMDPGFAKQQLELFLREWYMHPNGDLPAYEFNFGDVNPPMHAWAAWRTYKITGPRGQRDIAFLERVFHKLLITFTWWVNRKDPRGNNIFAGGFLGLDNIGVFDRSQPLPNGCLLERADGTAWMAFFCGTMLSIALELAQHNRAYEDIASKFLLHFVAIADAINHLGGHGLWDEEEGFYYDQLRLDGGRVIPLKVRSMVGIIPLFAGEILEEDAIRRLPGFENRMNWFLENRRDLATAISYLERAVYKDDHGVRRLLAIPTRERLERVLRYLLDENEFLSDFGIRSLSRIYGEQPYIFVDPRTGDRREVRYAPGESDTGLFGGNSNWRGPVWFPLNYLLIEALERYHHFYGDSFQVECPTGSGKKMDLGQVAAMLTQRLNQIFLPDAGGRRPVHGEDRRYAEDAHWRDLVLFYEYFHGEDGRGLGASHQTGWTALVTRLLRR